MKKFRVVIAIFIVGLIIEAIYVAAMTLASGSEIEESPAPVFTRPPSPTVTWTPFPETPEDEAANVTVGLNDWPGPNAIRAKWIDPTVSGEAVSIPLDEVTTNRNIHFTLRKTQDGDLDFMAYIVNEKIYVRSCACPPCKLGFTLDGDLLYCNACYSVFNARTGVGLRGGCVDFPKAKVAYAIKNGRIEMRYLDLVIAERLTMKPDYIPRIRDAMRLY